MKVSLAHRRFGVHSEVRDAEVPGDFSDYASPKPDATRDYVIDEGKLIAALPDRFLPCPPSRILLAVSDDLGGTGQTGLSLFRDWAKYFDAYCLNLVKEAS